jgi:YVTN family beta-propeller protein
MICLLAVCFFSACGKSHPENFNVVEIKTDGVTFESDHVSYSEDQKPSDWATWDLYFKLYRNEGHLIQQQWISTYIRKPRITHTTYEKGYQSYYITERAERLDYDGYLYVHESGKSDSISLALPDNIEVGSRPAALAIIEAARESTVFVANTGSDSVTMIGASTNNRVFAEISTGIEPVAIAADPGTNKIYVANSGNGTVSVIDAIRGVKLGDVNVGWVPCAIGVDRASHRIYVVNQAENSVTVIDGTDDHVITTIGVGDVPVALAVGDGKVYVANSNSNNVSIINEGDYSVSIIPVGATPVAIAYIASNKVCVANKDSNSVSIIDGSAHTAVSINVGRAPSAIAANPTTNKVYVINSLDDTVSVINTADQSVKDINLGIAGDNGAGYPAIRAKGPCSIAIDASSRNKIYVANADTDNVSVIDGSSNRVFIMESTGAHPVAIGVNGTNGEIFTINANDPQENGALMRSYPVTITPKVNAQTSL